MNGFLLFRLHEELEDFFQWMIPTPQEHTMRLGVVRRIREAVQEKWPRARVDVFGSFRTGLYLPTRYDNSPLLIRRDASIIHLVMIFSY